MICVDFDGTIVGHRFPQIGKPAPGAFKWLKKLQEAGARLILWTMRDDDRDGDGLYLKEAVDFCRANGVEFWALNANPEQFSWSNSKKCYANIYIDDAAFGCPLIPDSEQDRLMVDWSIVGPAVLKMIESVTP